MDRLTPTTGVAELCFDSGFEVAEGLDVDVDVGVEVGVIDPRLVLLAPSPSPPPPPSSPPGPPPCRCCNTDNSGKRIVVVETSAGLNPRLRSDK